MYGKDRETVLKRMTERGRQAKRLRLTNLMQLITSREETVRRRSVNDEEAGPEDAATRSALVQTKSEKSSPYLNTLCGFEYYNDLANRLPIYNLFHPFFSGNADVPAWDQISSVVETLAITTALILALVCTFHSAVSFADTMQTDIRFSQGLDTGNVNTSGVQGLLYNEDHGPCKVCGDPCNNGFPCFDTRIIDADGTTVSGNYAKWWNDPDHGEDGTVVENFNRTCVNSTAFLCTALIMSVIILGTGSANVFTRQQAPKTYQRDVVLGSFFWWLKICLILVILFTVIGIIFFFQTVKYMVMIKYTNEYVATEGKGQNWMGAGADDTYTFVETIVLWLTWIPVVIIALVASKAHHHAYTYPVRPWSNIMKDMVDDKVYRHETAVRLTKFLRETCKLPSTHQNIGSGPWGNKFDVFLAQAGGVPACEAEIVAHVLIDAGVDTEDELIKLVSTDVGWLKDLPGISLGAAASIVLELKSDSVKEI
eukprot:m.336139 g.336139  ORF g.336139 m.336139 type:complete len:482 (+) comp17768_c0_seq1:180-1625(+)